MPSAARNEGASKKLHFKNLLHFCHLWVMEEPSEYYEGVARIRNWCARRDRSTAEVHRKLTELGFTSEQCDKAIQQLTDEQFLDDLRFAESFASGHLRIKKWGRIKIAHALKQHQLSEQAISAAIKAVFSEEEYLDNLTKVLRSKGWKPGQTLSYDDRQKLLRYAYQRGFEPSLINELLDAKGGKA